MSKKNQETRLRPGEIKILKALVKGNKTFETLAFEELASETKLNRTCLSDYLKRLQKIGLLAKDIETRKYHVTEDFSEETLFVSDIAQLIQSQVDKTISEKNSFSFGVGFCTVENNSEFMRHLETTFAEKPENLVALKKITNIVLDAWKEFVMSSRSFSENERKIIRKSMQLTEELRQITKGQIKTMYQHQAVIYATSGFKASVVNMKDSSQYNDVNFTLSDTEKKRYSEILNFQKDKKNEKVWEKWFNKEQNSPKTLLVFTPLGFSAFNYEERIEKLLPKESEKT
jgi:predicted transcriptional regulator